MIAARSASLIFLLSVLPAGAAVTLFQREDFDTFGGWESGDPNPNPPVLFPYSGATGEDSALRLTANGGSGRGGKLVVFNQTTWSGDYASAGITTIAADLRNLGGNSLSIQLAFNGPGGWFVTDAATLTAFSGWNSVLFDLRPGSLLPVSGATGVTATLASVSEVRILHATSPGYQGSQVSGVLLVDHFQAVPEPSVPLSLALAGMVAFRRKR